mmetsp:Transcript_13354/g.30455  ORF Transcript_13354/g.30455 Transcript_13354/m.30455 type:complete len:259 (-) Transcript_13354:83-859(-)
MSAADGGQGEVVEMRMVHGRSQQQEARRQANLQTVTLSAAEKESVDRRRAESAERHRAASQDAERKKAGQNELQAKLARRRAASDTADEARDKRESKFAADKDYHEVTDGSVPEADEVRDEGVPKLAPDEQGDMRAPTAASVEGDVGAPGAVANELAAAEQRETAWASPSAGAEQTTTDDPKMTSSQACEDQTSHKAIVETEQSRPAAAVLAASQVDVGAALEVEEGPPSASHLAPAEHKAVQQRPPEKPTKCRCTLM